jgi:fluoroacetyl-CoA thioesterase
MGSVMAKPVPLGTRGVYEEDVKFETTLSFHHPELPPVLSTPDMIRMMETACFHALHPYCEGDEINVGTAINVEHRAATGLGARVTATAELERIEGRFFVMRVLAHDGRQEIGRGWVHRAIVSKGQFEKKMKEKMAGQ